MVRGSRRWWMVVGWCGCWFCVGMAVGLGVGVSVGVGVSLGMVVGLGM